MLIMSIDDSPQTRRFIGECVRKLGYDFIEASDAAEALELLRTEVPGVNLVLVERRLPGMDGMALLRHMKNDPILSGIPVVMATAEADGALVIDAVRCGAAAYLMKPFSREDLIEKIMETLGTGNRP